MKLAIASTTILFAMMAAQAAVLSVAPATDVNLVKRAPNGDDEADVEQSAMVEQSSLDPTPQDPLTEQEEQQLKDLYSRVNDARFKSIHPINSKDDEVKKLKFTIKKLQNDGRKGKSPFDLRKIDAEIVELEKELVELKEQLKMLMEEHKQKKVPKRNSYNNQLINAICSGTDNDVFTLNVQGQLVRSQHWFWSRRTKQLYRNRYWLTPQVRPKTVKQRHSFALMETLRTCGDSASLQKYVTRQLLDTSGFFKDPSFDQSRAHGTRYLMLARMDALWTARKAIQIGILVDTHPFSVDHCILCDQQLLSTSIAHLVVECEQVTGHRIQSGLVPAIQKSRLRLLGRALDPGVENVYTWLRGGVLNGEADLGQRWLDGTVEHESMGTRHDNRALAARLADFLQVAYRQYQSTLWKYHRDRLVEVG
ncbi:hypothetical protein BASA50_010019 [Batrachochytrium salamandrivorans]|uniref:Uncharacterized protein n=1 Tax=Batrachochytrium salamandrivorans TaxID=1357716 RepID=A0ABQ8EZQ2_9FUNG|nr:hypothetical protein BASA50_010019 [Batrachochytrium salamandrivorans]